MSPTNADDSTQTRTFDPGRPVPHIEPSTSAPRTRIVVLGGGVGGLAAARHLDRWVARRPDVDVTLVSRDNFFLLSPLLFEACSGVLETARRGHWPGHQNGSSARGRPSYLGMDARRIIDRYLSPIDSGPPLTYRDSAQNPERSMTSRRFEAAATAGACSSVLLGSAVT